MQPIAFSKSLLNEFNRCDRAFVMSLNHPKLANEYLLNHPCGINVDTENALAYTRTILEDTEDIANLANDTGGIKKIEVNTSDPWEKVRQTEAYLYSGEPVVISDGAVTDGTLVVPFSLACVRQDGLWDIYHMTSKGFYNQTRGERATERMAAEEAGMLMRVLANIDAPLANLFVVGVNGKFRPPYPDPETGEIRYMDRDGISIISYDFNNESVMSVAAFIDPTERLERIQWALSDDPFWIPDAEMGSQCNRFSGCPFSAYCKSLLPQDSIRFVPFSRAMGSKEKEHLIAAGLDTLSKMADYMMNENPTMENIPYPTSDGEKYFHLSDYMFRELDQFIRSRN